MEKFFCDLTHAQILLGEFFCHFVIKIIKLSTLELRFFLGC